MKKLLAVALTLIAVSTAPLHAEYADDDCFCSITCGFYLSGFGGINWWTDHFGHENDTPGAIGAFEMDMGYTVGGALGYRLCNGIRTEFEVAYRHTDYSDVKSHHNAGSGVTFMRMENSEWDITSYMMNFVFDGSIIICDYCYRPYFGAGFGVAHIDLDMSVDVDGIDFGGQDDNDWVFAYQLIAGVALPINDCWDFALEYRFFNLHEAEFTVTGGSTPIIFDSRNWTHAHELIISTRYMIGSDFF